MSRNFWFMVTVGAKPVIGEVVVEVAVGAVDVAGKSLDIRSVVGAVVEVLFGMVVVVGLVVVVGTLVVVGAVGVAGAVGVVRAVDLAGELISRVMTRKCLRVFMGLHSFLGPFLEPCLSSYYYYSS